MAGLAVTWTKKRLWWAAYAARGIASRPGLFRSGEPDLVLFLDILGCPAIGVVIFV